MAAPAAACLIYSGIFTYFGCHILKREIIFVDIALAQLAALGVTLYDTFGRDHSEWEATLLSLILIVAGASFFSYTKKLKNRAKEISQVMKLVRNSTK